MKFSFNLHPTFIMSYVTWFKRYILLHLHAATKSQIKKKMTPISHVSQITLLDTNLAFRRRDILTTKIPPPPHPPTPPFNFFGLCFYNYWLHNKQYPLIIVINIPCLQYGLYCLLSLQKHSIYVKGQNKITKPKNSSALWPPPPSSDITGSAAVRGFCLCRYYFY